MGKVNKVYPSFYNGVSEQPPELMLDANCKEMTNCIPSLVNNLRKRPPVTFMAKKNDHNEQEKVIHVYDRGENSEEYIFVSTNDLNDPIEVYSKSGVKMTVQYDSETESDLKDYLHNGRLKGLTVQDRTWLINKDKEVIVDTTDSQPLNEYYDRTAYYWLKRGSGDRYNPYNYAVYLNGVQFAVNPNKPSGATDDPATGAEDTNWAAADLAAKINNQVLSLYKASIATVGAVTVSEDSLFLGKNLTNVSAPIITGTTNYTVNNWSYDSVSGMYEYKVTILENNPITCYVEVTADNVGGFKCEVSGSVLKIYRENGGDFDFSSWDSWGDQASEGWKGSVNKLTDLPREMPFAGAYVQITGDNNDNFTNYYVRWNGSSWEETRDPKEIRGKLTNMPIACDRIDLQGEIATFKFYGLTWSEPRVGNIDNNPDPSFVGYTITDLFFYRNRLGIASTDSVVLTETANYENFYIKTAIDVVDTDPIDVSIASNQASKIYYTKPFNNSLYIFTKYAQYELKHEGFLSPETVAIDNVTNYPMAVDVEPRVVNNSLFFVSITNNKQQLREYIKTEKLIVEGIDLNITTPNYLSEPITQILVNGVLGMVFCCTSSNIVYMYNYKEDGQQRVQSSWSRWSLLEGLETLPNSFEYHLLDATMLIICKTANNYLYHNLQLDDLVTDNKVDITLNNEQLPYKASVTLPEYYPHISKIGTPKDKILLKKVAIQGSGSFNADVYRKDYNRTFTKTSSLGLKDLDLHIASKVGNVEITIYDDSTNDFNISSITVEGLYSPTSKEMR